MGHFESRSPWGFPYKIRKIVEAFNHGELTIDDALCKLGGMYGSNTTIYYTYDNNGHKVPVTCIKFGCPVVASFVIK